MTSFISTHSISASMRQSVLQMQADLAANQTELSSGVYADLGVQLAGRTGESVSLQADSSMLKTILDTNSAVVARLGVTQTSLAGMQSGAQNLLNALIESNGAASTTATIQVSAKNDLKGLISSLNTTSDGSFIFAGINSNVQPITDYYGTSATNKSAVDAAFLNAFGIPQISTATSSISPGAMQAFLDGAFSNLFQGPSWTQTWSSAATKPLTNQISPSVTAETSVSANEPAFQKLAQAYTMVADLGSANLQPATNQVVSLAAQKLLSSAIGLLTDMQANVGATQSAVTKAGGEMSLQIDLLSTQIGDLENVNTYEASTRITNLQTQIETAYALTSQLHDLSLVKFL